MFGFLKKNKINSVELHSICNGEVLTIENVPDKVFASKMLGDGVGFSCAEEQIYAPCDGKIIMVANTNHAIGIRLSNDAEVLIHVGLDTVNLGGKGLTPLVKVGEKIKCGQPIMKIDQKYMKDNNVDLTSPMVLTTSEGYELNILNVEKTVSLDDTVMEIRRI